VSPHNSYAVLEDRSLPASGNQTLVPCASPPLSEPGTKGPKPQTSRGPLPEEGRKGAKAIWAAEVTEDSSGRC